MRRIYNETESTGQVTILAYLEMPSERLIGRTLENHENPVSITSVSSETQTG
jgi:hypothetical protein